MHDLVKALLYRTAAASADLKDIRRIEMRATVTADADAAALAPIVASLESAAPSMRNEQGRPTIMLVDAWMCHADRVNLNGDAFVASELEEIVNAGLFQAPNFGVMDWNHAAVFSWTDDPPLIGVWYDATYELDTAADAWGIRVKGMVFAWLFPAQASEMLADQVRNGYVSFSMACLSDSVEFGVVDGKQATILHRPTFFTNSALNRPPADADAKGRVSESPTEWASWPDELALALSLAQTDEEPDEYDTSADEIDTELDDAWDMSEAKTDFPAKGDDKVVSLRNSQWKTFPISYAEDLKENWPEIWRRGGNIRGNDQYRKLTPVVRRKGTVEGATEERAVRLREAWGARHFEDKRLNGVVAQIKWYVVGSQGVSAMKKVITEAKEMVTRQRKAARLASTRGASAAVPALRAATRINSADAQEPHMDKELELKIAELSASLETLKVTVTAQAETLTAQAGQITEKDLKVVQLTTELATAAGEVEALTAKLSDAELVRAALTSEVEAAKALLTDLQTKFDGVTAELATYVERDRAAEVVAKLATRLSELPESVRKAHEGREAELRSKVEARWATMADEQWAEYLDEVKTLIPDAHLSMAARSAREGILPAGGADSSTDDAFSGVRALIKTA